jgi:flagella basal body P-ring formation protein FlgA
MKATGLLLVAACFGLGGLARASEVRTSAKQLPAGPAAPPEATEQRHGARPQLPVRIYLPRIVLVEKDPLDLGSISVIRCDDRKLMKKAEAVTMGRTPWPKERIVIDRRTILSRLEIKVGRDERVFNSPELLRAAKAVLEKERPGPPGCSWRLVGGPAELVAPASGEIALKAELAKGAPADHAKVRVSASAGERALAVRELLFKVVHPARRAVTKKEIPAGDVITTENTSIETVMVERRPSPDWTAPYGMIANRRLPAGTVIEAGMARRVKPAIVIRRNHNVVMRIRGFGFTITAVGLALQDGRAGDFIKVRNVDTRRVITARVVFDGTVEPVFEEVTK